MTSATLAGTTRRRRANRLRRLWSRFRIWLAADLIDLTREISLHEGYTAAYDSVLAEQLGSLGRIHDDEANARATQRRDSFGSTSR